LAAREELDPTQNREIHDEPNDLATLSTTLA
jgi:hypothetical protein